jgi:quinone-modifying oxidoreductase subunit QmoA
MFSKQVQSDPNVSVVKGKVAKIIEDPSTKELRIEVEDILSARKSRIQVDLVVLATGMMSNVDGNTSGIPIDLDKDNFALPRYSAPGVFSAGCARGPVDVATSVQDATAAVMEAIQAIHLAQPRQHA